MVIRTIKITDLRTKIRRQDLILHINFRIVSPKHKLARIKVEIYFDGERIKSFYPIVMQKSTLEDLPIKSIINLEYVSPGRHSVRADITGLGSLAGLPDSKKASFDYPPGVRTPVIKEIPNARRVEAPRVVVITEDLRKFYRQMRERRKKELVARREK